MAAKSRSPKRKPTRRKRPAAKPARRGAARKPAIPGDLDRRLRALAAKMDKTLDAILLQALCEFADAWEDHFRTVTALADDERVQVVVKPET
ncbi:MAG: hypothetical protein FJX59_01240 [Alphaproteobacteria bacterium]|nr:hypothetical protein [Alphaproteobacteria bacterium]